jgi:hypothetical protein
MVNIGAVWASAVKAAMIMRNAAQIPAHADKFLLVVFIILRVIEF